MSATDPSRQVTESASGAATADSRAPHADVAPGGRSELLPGDCVGRYTVRALIGAGGMGQVFAATDSELGRTVALKVIRPDRVASSAARARLLREAQALALLHHPNVVTVHDVGTQGDHVFLAMELVAGTTLGDWLHAEPRSWRVVRDVFLAAGGGLAAAHAVGIVHRDFKPHNVIVGTDRVVVVDFGLARASGHGPEPADDALVPDSPQLALTLTGERVGTPRYMAPEQRAGELVTARSDQFAFCVALEEALLGDAGAPVRPVPRFVAAAIARGLAARPEDRWPSMEALLAALGQTFWTRRRKRAAGATGAVLVAAIAILGFTVGERAAAIAPCDDGGAAIAPLWNDATRAVVHAAFQRSGRARADESFARVDGAMRDRLAGWARTYHDNCEATHVRHEQSEAMLDLRAQCLGRARTELAALIALLQNADGAVVKRAPDAVDEVGDVARCADRAALGATIAPPPPAQAHEVELLRDEAARSAPLFQLGKWNAARTATHDLVTRARRLGYKPLLAQALAQQAEVEVNAGPVDAAITDLYEVAQLGTEAGDDDVVAKALPWLEYALSDGKARYEAAGLAYRWAAAAVARAGATPARLIALYGNHAVALGQQGDHEGALALYRSLLELETQHHGPDSFGVGWSLRSIGEELAALGHGRDATPYYERAAALLERTLEPGHPAAAMVAADHGRNLVDVFAFDRAVPVLQRAIASYERTLGPDDLNVATTLSSLGVAYLGLRRLPEARAAVERAIAIHHKRDESEGRGVAQAYEALADIASHEGKPGEALALVERALPILATVVGPAHEQTGLAYRLDATYLLALDRPGEARAALDQALAIDGKARGKDHPELGAARMVEGDLRAAAHKPRDAVVAYDQALQIFEHGYGASSVGLCPVLSRLSAALRDAGDAARAESVAERAVSLARTAPPGELEIAQARLAEARWARAVDRAGALALAKHARAQLAALPFPSDELPRLDRWLATVR